MNRQEKIHNDAEPFVVDLGMILAGWVTKGPAELVPFNALQVQVIMSAAIGAYVRNHPEFDEQVDRQMDISGLLNLALHTYAESVKASAVSALSSTIAQSQDITGLVAALGLSGEGDDSDLMPDDEQIQPTPSVDFMEVLDGLSDEQLRSLADELANEGVPELDDGSPVDAQAR